MSDTLSKNDAIRQTLVQTRQRHSQMYCRVYEVKAAGRKLSRAQRDQVNQYFREAKWLRNAVIADPERTWKNPSCVSVKTGSVFEERPLTILGSQVKQSVISSVHSNLASLHTQKQHGRKVGKLGFSSVCNSVDHNTAGADPDL